jgi:hypothetical protein
LSDTAPRWKDGTVASIQDLECVMHAFGFTSETSYENYCKIHDRKRDERHRAEALKLLAELDEEAKNHHE